MAKYVRSVRSPALLLQTLLLTSLINVLRGLVIFVQPRNGWYERLNKPYVDVPLWSFSPVGIVVYLCLGMALYCLVLSPTHESKTLAYISFGTQCVLGVLWPLVFFVFHAPWASFVITLLLIASIIWSIRELDNFDERTMYWQAPHLLWAMAVCFLNLSVALLN
jgi:tryptophan-rich sensory protein